MSDFLKILSPILLDTSIAELLKSKTESDDFLASLECEQELLNGMDTDKINSHIEDLCHRKEPLVKILRLLIVQCKFTKCKTKNRICLR